MLEPLVKTFFIGLLAISMGLFLWGVRILKQHVDAKNNVDIPFVLWQTMKMCGAIGAALSFLTCPMFLDVPFPILFWVGAMTYFMMLIWAGLGLWDTVMLNKLPYPRFMVIELYPWRESNRFWDTLGWAGCMCSSIWLYGIVGNLAVFWLLLSLLFCTVIFKTLWEEEV